MDKFYVTTPIYYVNDVPHIGHAYTTVAADVLARFWQLTLGKENVFFLTGTDEHGVKVAQAAKEADKEPKEFADLVSPKFQETWKLLNIEPSYFIRTTDPRHEKVASETLQKIKDNGYIYEDIYEGLYCEGCEKFLTEEELVDGKCPLHPNKEPVYQKEKNYFFKLKEVVEKEIYPRIKSGEIEVSPEKRRHEVLSRVELGVKDISVSRAGVSWGIPVPWDNKQTIYVWVEALLNYYTATRFLENKEKFWPAELHLVGKDILWFHAVIWPALLFAAGIPLPKKVFAHGFFTINNQKMSKSLGNVISPQELVNKFGVDGARYLLLSAFSFGEDGDFSFSKLTEKYNAELANGLGNLVARTAKLCEGIDFDQTFETHFLGNLETGGFEVNLRELHFSVALEKLWREIKELNVKIDNEKPWEKSLEQRKQFLPIIIGKILSISSNLQPFLPETAEKIEQQFKGPKMKSSLPLFPRQ